MIGMTLCSGIGAPEVAAPWMDWRLALEIEKFPRAVLQHRLGYKEPAEHNQGEPLLWGDMREVTPALLGRHGIPLPNMIVTGTPCQAFSVAGARGGLEDPRGNLTLAFVDLLHTMVAARPDGKLAVLWENVPGVLSDKGNAFGCFLGGFVGSLDALPKPAGGSWPSEGMVEVPRARAAWAVLDAQWFGVSQRRERVFVVADFGRAVDPAAVLLEPDSLRGDTPPRRKEGQGAAADVAPSLVRSGRGVERIGETRGQDPVVAQMCAEIAPTLDASFHDKQGLDNQHINGGDCSLPPVAMCLNGHGARLDAESETLLPVTGGGFDVAHSLRGEGFDASEDGTGRETPLVPVAFDCKGTEVQFQDDGAHPPLRSMGHLDSHQNAGGHAVVAYAIQERPVSENIEAGPQGKGWQEEVAYTLEARHHVQAAAQQWAVRRLMPIECARLQAFPDDWTQIPWRGKPAEQCPDGPQYKALGNSMATVVVNTSWTACGSAWQRSRGPSNDRRTDHVAADFITGLMYERDEALDCAAMLTDKAGHLAAVSFFTRIC